MIKSILSTVLRYAEICVSGLVLVVVTACIVASVLTFLVVIADEFGVGWEFFSIICVALIIANGIAWILKKGGYIK